MPLYTVGLGERKAISAILTEAQKSDYGLRALVHAIVSSELFRNK